MKIVFLGDKGYIGQKLYQIIKNIEFNITNIEDSLLNCIQKYNNI